MNTFFQLLTEGYQVLAFYIPEFLKERKPRYLEFASFQEGHLSRIISTIRRKLLLLFLKYIMVIVFHLPS